MLWLEIEDAIAALEKADVPGKPEKPEKPGKRRNLEYTRETEWK